ncbi:MAG TPA: DUF5615 family PIN-like protein [Actinomycetota bacterium]|nr:DUF5615 family PIN-like protein [Actinomycetota bacterium]
MRILLDESVHRGVKGLLIGHDVQTVRELGWSSIQNGELLRRASLEFDVLVTADQGIPHQQNLAKFDIAVVVLAATSNRLNAYEALANQLREAVGNATAGRATVVTP